MIVKVSQQLPSFARMPNKISWTFARLKCIGRSLTRAGNPIYSLTPVRAAAENPSFEAHAESWSNHDLISRLTNQMAAIHNKIEF